MTQTRTRTPRRLHTLCAALLIALAAILALGAAPARATEAEDNSALGFFTWFRFNAKTEAAYNDAQAAIDVLTASNYIYSGICDSTRLGATDDASSLYNMYMALDTLDEINAARTGQGKSALRINLATMAQAINQCNYFHAHIGNGPTYAYGAEIVATDMQNPLYWWNGSSRPETYYQTMMSTSYNVAAAALHFDASNWEYNPKTGKNGATWDVSFGTAASSQQTYTVAAMRSYLAYYIENVRIPGGMTIGRWATTGDGYYLFRKWDGSLANYELLTINGVTYGFGGDSICYADTIANIAGKLYHFDKTGALTKNDWVYDKDNHTYHYAGADGALVSKTWKSYNGNWYYLGEDTALVTNKWVKDNGKYYHINASGIAETDTWIKQNGVWLYLGSDGAVVTNGWVDYNGARYYMKQNGTVLTSGWISSDGSWYYLGPDGKMFADKWLSSGGKLYYFDSSGKMVTNAWKKNGDDWYFLGENGASTTNAWIKVNGAWYFLGNDGRIYTNNWIKVNDDWYYLGADGRAVTDAWQDGYYLGPDGKARASA